MPRFLHTADWQIGRQYDRFGPEDGPALAQARLTTVERIAALATELAVDAVLVAGDVFDAQTISDRTVRRLFMALQGFGGPWVMLPGNHDAALAESIWSRARRLNAIPDNVHVLLTAEPLLLAEQGLAILPAPLTQRQTFSDLTDWFDHAPTPPQLLRIGLAHGSVQGILAEDIDSPNPIDPQRAARARLDYLALGDWHGCRQIDDRTWYSGTPEQDRFKSNGAGQVLDVQIDAPGAAPQVKPVAMGEFTWLQWQRRLQVASDLDALIEELEQIERSSVISLTLEGELDLAGEQRLQAALGRAEARHRVLECQLDGMRLLPTEADIAALQADGYLDEVVGQLRDMQQADEPEVAREALAILAGLLRERQTGGTAV
ncbi:DNA repair exonuclease [Pseudomonas sp. G11-1]|uniref:DNA repair exonuclease n=1 Tax=Halopseudomonas bauzanensis TaxID=653930 RepID=A0A4U0YI93_9GAMM|nr:DNA repair exonuclease [Halopseudomonas bauzanensis]MCO5784938.1 DNA repair exonuclease [Pseudomonas sp. G11-1]MCO5788959.1 DNA repair exonuclease [Pseudomonas sp. G11-2]TKA90868.1 DNA repair exonuclease [Halopseudomonas bauzanensis]